MDYEKAYKDALERAREEFGSGCYDKGTIEYIFPELAESEDERIRKDIISFLKANKDFAEDWIAWLERQGEHKCKEDFEYNGCIWRLNESVTIEHEKYYYCVQDYYSGGRKQASKGDIVQALRGMSMMGLDSKKAAEYFQPVNFIEPKWSEDDEAILSAIINVIQVCHPDAMWRIDTSKTAAVSTKFVINWLKTLKPQNWKPTNEQMEALDKVYKTHGADCECRHILLGLLNDLKKL